MIGTNTQLKAGIYTLLTLFALFLLIQLLLGSLYVAVRPGALSSPSSLYSSSQASPSSRRCSCFRRGERRSLYYASPD